MPCLMATPRLRRLALGLGVCLNIGVRISAKGEGGEGGEASWIEGSLRIPRERNLSLKDYYEKYEDAQTPVIIEDYAAAFAGMSEANIKAVCGTKEVSVARRVDEEGSWANIEWYESGSLVDTWEMIKTESKKAKFDDFEPDEGELLGLFDWSLQKGCPEVLEKHFVVPKYFAQDYLQRVPHRIDVNYRDAWPSLFVAIDGGYGGTHRDVFGSAFWMFVMEGAKEWVIVDSTEDLNFFGPDKPRVRQYHDIVQKGQLLIIPGNRWHQVRNRGNTVTLAGNFVGRGSFDVMKQVVEGDPDPGPYYGQLQNTLLAPGFDTSIDYDQDDMTWEEFRSPEDSEMFHELEEATFAVLVTGAGSPEVNGCYKFNGENENAWQFVRTNAGRTFEIFKVEEDAGWWNILEKIGEEYPNPVHYGSEGDIDSVLPQGDDWDVYQSHWLGMDPPPKVEVTTEKTCLSWTEMGSAAIPQERNSADIPVRDSWGKIVSNAAVPQKRNSAAMSAGDGWEL